MTAGWPQNGVYKLDARAGGAVWFVPSKSEPGAYRKVEWHHHPATGIVYTCSCPAGQHRGQMRGNGEHHERPCRHVLAAADAERAADQAVASPRQQGHINPSSFVD